MATINMLSSADLIKGQGVSSAYYEQVNLVSEGLKDKYEVLINAKKKCDIIHFHTINPEYFIKMNRNKKRSSFVGYVHFLPDTVEQSLDIPKTGRKLFYKYMIEFYNSMDYLVTVNPYFIGELVKYGIDKQKVTYIPNYVSENLFYPYTKLQKEELKKHWGIPEERFVVLGVGQVQTRKGIFDFIETARKIPEAYFIWAGGFSFGPMTEGYKELKALMLNPPENVNFLGIIEREEMNDIYNIADVMFLPSYSELFPMTILESMCVGKPILLRDLEIYHDILFDYYLRGNDVEDFIEVIENLKSDSNYYQKWSDKSLDGHNFYSKENVLKMWEEFYDHVYETNKDRIEEYKGLNKKERNKLKRTLKKLEELNKKRNKIFKVSNSRKKKDKIVMESNRIIALFKEDLNKE